MRESSLGDSCAAIRLGVEYARRGLQRESYDVFLKELEREPNNQDVLRAYLDGGGFHASRVEDPVLGDAILYRNLPYPGGPLDIVVGCTPLDKGWERTFEKWKEYSARRGVGIVNCGLDFLIHDGMHLFSGHSAFRVVTEHYITTRCKRPANDWRVYGEITADSEGVSLEEMDLNGRWVRREIRVPFYNETFTVIPANFNEHLCVFFEDIMGVPVGFRNSSPQSEIVCPEPIGGRSLLGELCSDLGIAESDSFSRRTAIGWRRPAA